MITNPLYVKENAKLVILLTAAGIPHEVRTLYDGTQVLYPNLFRSVGDVVCHSWSYGRERGLLEVMGVGCEDEDDNVEGWLTAETIFDRWQKHWSLYKNFLPH